ncbi:MAG TPA: cardiolipin synthase [Burkholderiales bacterium]|jgi:cardiolipin synthase|nr:cardiolipin synthase [Burkholderiales bacterium]
MAVELARRLGALRRWSDTTWRIGILTFLATGLGVLLAANLSLGDKKIDTSVASLYGVGDPQFVRAMNVMLGPALVPGNRTRALVNGDEIFPEMLEAIRGARKSITFEMYIYWKGAIGEQFTAALEERARSGVKVHVMIDALGSQKIEKTVLGRLRDAGARVELYNPVRWDTIARMNNRTHRKIMVIDGAVGFTGGAGIGDEWSGDAQDAEHWRDTHFRLEGPAVAQMQAAFMENWIEVTGEVLHGPEYFPELRPVGGELAQFVVSSPGGGGESAQLLYLMSIAAAQRSIQLSAAYFVPDDNEVRQLVEARERGVRVQIIVPGPATDSAAVRRASRSTWGELLRAGVEIYEYQPTFYHVKVMTVDGLWVTVGSTNFDTRSFSTNDEANLNVYDRAFAAEGERIFERDLGRSRRITLEEWEARPLREKLLEHAAGLLSSQL